MRSALIAGLKAYELSDEERVYFKDARPAGMILFARNCRDHDQVRALVAETRAAVGSDDFLVLIDQEGGRVQRLRGELGRTLPPARRYGDLHGADAELALEAAYSVARLVAEDLRALGINTNCAPVLDLPVEGAHDIIGDRAYSIRALETITLARQVMEGYAAGGVLPVIKHIPGHGRATADSHLVLPVVTTQRDELSRTDFVPFRALSQAPLAMTAHVVYADIDPDQPASTSRHVTQEIIRGEIGFNGLLMSDDLSMQALSGPMRQRAESVINAGSDVALHCNGDMIEMRAVVEGVPVLADAALARFSRACRKIESREPFDEERALWLLAEMLKPHLRSSESV